MMPPVCKYTSSGFPELEFHKYNLIALAVDIIPRLPL
jgi:hypothetical protein